MLIAQITDLHLGFEPDNPDEYNRRRLEFVLARLRAMRPAPDIVIATGDLTEYGSPEAYRGLREAFDALGPPVLTCLGNHDSRDAFREAFPEVPVIAGGFVQYVHDVGPLRLVVLDTLEEGRHGGAFCEVRARWLADRLDEAPDRPTLIVQHHPPVETGIGWMTVDPQEPWIARLAGVLEGRGQVIGMICGHIHRAMIAPWHGIGVTVCSSTAPQVALELAPVDPDRPDGRPMIIAELPGYALHYWTGSGLVTHFETAGDQPVLAHYDDEMQPTVSLLMEEPRGE